MAVLKGGDAGLGSARICANSGNQTVNYNIVMIHTLVISHLDVRI